MSPIAHGFTLDALRVEPAAGLVAGPGGNERLDPKVMDVLVQMAEHAGQVVLREDLLARLWPNVVVSDDALTRCFYELRRCLARAGGDERYRTLLETLPKRGYRLNGTVRPILAVETALEPAAAPPEPTRTRRGLLGIGAAALAIVAIVAGLSLWRTADRPGTTAASMAPRSIAVLPFMDMSAGKDHGYFSDGVSEEILNRLSQSEGLRVISRTSSFALRDEDLDVPQIAERLDVDFVLEGSVRRSGERVRVTAQLIDAATNSHVWSRTFDGEVAGIFTIQDEVARSVAAALEVALRIDPAPAGRSPPLDAYEDYLQGQFLYGRRSPGDIELSIRYFEKSVAADPGYARAWATLAGAYSLMAGGAGTSAPEWREKQGAAARRAVELDPELATAQARLAQYYLQTGERERGNVHFQKALALDPNDLLVLGFSATRALFRGEIDDAVAIWRRIVARDPLSPINRANYAHHLLRAGRHDEAVVELRKALELNPGAVPYVRTELASALVLAGRFGEARQIVDDLPDGADRDYVLALMHESPEHRDQADAALERLRKPQGGATDPVRLAEALASRGRRDEAFAVLQARHAEIDGGGVESSRQFGEFREQLWLSYRLAPLNDDPRWQPLTLRG